MSPRVRKRVIVVLAAVLAVPIIFWGAAEFTSRPKFCNSCHYMKPFYESWQVSTHADISCTYCHFEPGLAGKIEGKLNGLFQLTKYVSLAYKKSKPWAEISDASCTRQGCHETQTLLGPIRFKDVKFDHSHHLGELRRKKQLRCTSCHSQMVQGSHILVTEETCFLCHMKDRDQTTGMLNCRTCHTDEIFLEMGSQLRYNHTTIVQTNKSCESCHINTIEGNAPVSLQQCINCHWQTDFFERYEDPEFLHKNHVTDHKIECTACHTPISHRIQRKHLLTGEDCRSCHQDQHVAQAQLFAGLGGADIPQQPDPMFTAGLSCQSCHIFHEENISGSETMVSSAEACDQCHGQGYGHLLQNWGTYLAHLEADVISYLEQTRTSLDQRDGLTPERKEVLEHANQYILLVLSAGGIHNIQLSDNLLKAAHDLISQTLQEAGLENLTREYVSSGQLVPSDCANCHFGIEEITVKVYDLNFQHGRHLTIGVACTKCHSNLRVHGELLHTRADCLNCHHSQEEKDCSTCHLKQQQLLAGETPFFTSDPDLMWAEDITCQECHLAARGVMRRSPELCADCHDDSYAAMVLEWRDEIQALLGSLPDKPYSEQKGWLTSEGSLGGHNPQAIIDYLENALKTSPRP